MAPEVEIFGALDATFTYSRQHCEYVIFELLKNSSRAVVERRTSGESSASSVATTASTNPRLSTPAQRPTISHDSVETSLARAYSDSCVCVCVRGESLVSRLPPRYDLRCVDRDERLVGRVDTV